MAKEMRICSIRECALPKSASVIFPKLNDDGHSSPQKCWPLMSDTACRVFPSGYEGCVIVDRIQIQIYSEPEFYSSCS